MLSISVTPRNTYLVARGLGHGPVAANTTAVFRAKVAGACKVLGLACLEASALELRLAAVLVDDITAEAPAAVGALVCANALRAVEVLIARVRGCCVCAKDENQKLSENQKESSTGSKLRQGNAGRRLLKCQRARDPVRVNDTDGV